MTSHPIFPPSDASRRGAVVLVHGAWVGAWCWEGITTRLRASGRPTFVVSLTGHGSRRHQGGPHVTLTHHVDDLAAVLETHDLVDATVVAHSYGGRVITKAWPRIAHRTARLVYLDAHAPLGPRERADVTSWRCASDAPGMIPMTGYEPGADVLGGDEAVAWFLDRIAPQSLATLTEPFWVDLPDDVAKTYVRATANRDGRYDAYADDAAGRSDWGYREIPGDHWLIYTHPDEVVDAIVGDEPTENRRARTQEMTT